MRWNIIHIWLMLLFSMLARGQNILISSKGFPNEPSITIDPKNPARMLAGANINNYYVSIDSGYTWNPYTLTSSHGVWGDPAVTIDTAGHFYFFHLSNPPQGNWIDRIVCQKTADNGLTWTDGSFTGLNGTKAQDKHWPAIDRRNNHIYLTWTQFDNYGSINSQDSSIILFSKSMDAGITWTEPKRISAQAGDCIDSDNTVEGAVPAIGPSGEVYVSWAGPEGIVFNRSLDGGQTWLDRKKKVIDIPGGWDFEISGIYRANGLPVTGCDVSNSDYRGTIYINWSDQRNGPSDTDVWLIKSVDGGVTWSTPKKVNDDGPGKQQFFTWMNIDQTTGFLYFVFYDRRAYFNDLTDVYIAVSMDGGETFINHRISESPFMPDSNVFFGDYTNISVHNGVIRPIWTRLHNGKLSVWTDITILRNLISGTGLSSEDTGDNFAHTYPNPTNDITYVSYKLRKTSIISLDVLDMDGNPVVSVLKNKIKDSGKHIEEIDLSHLNISTGSYFLKLTVDGNTKVMRQIFID